MPDSLARRAARRRGQAVAGARTGSRSVAVPPKCQPQAHILNERARLSGHGDRYAGFGRQTKVIHRGCVPTADTIGRRTAGGGRRDSPADNQAVRAIRLNHRVFETGSQLIRIAFARLCRETRTELDIPQRELAAAVGVSRAYIASVESGRANPSLAVVERIAVALGIELALVGRRRMVVPNPRQTDLVHARCSGFVDRRLRSCGWEVRREVTIGHGRTKGWIDLLAYEPRRRILLVIEVKTAIDDVGAIERQIDWYEHEARSAVLRFGWHPTRIVGWLLVLSTDDVDDRLRQNRDVVDRAFPDRAPSMRDLLLDGDASVTRRGLALIDPHSRQRDWLRRTRHDGRRTPAPYRGYHAAAALMSAPGTIPKRTSVAKRSR